MIRTIFAVAVVVMATSCTDLDVDVKSKYTEYPTESEVALEAKMADVYYAFRNALGNNYNRYQAFASDEASGLSFDGDYYDGAENVNPTLHNFKAEDGPLNYWPDLASGITKCNKAIDEFGESSDELIAMVTSPSLTSCMTKERSSSASPAKRWPSLSKVNYCKAFLPSRKRIMLRPTGSRINGWRKHCL